MTLYVAKLYALAMINVRIVARYRKIVDLKSFIKGDGSCVKCFGPGIINGKHGGFFECSAVFSNLNRNLYLHGSFWVNNTTSDVLCNKNRTFHGIVTVEKVGYYNHGSRYYSNVEEENLLVKDKTDGNEWGGTEAEKLIVKIENDFIESIKTYESLLVYFYTLWCKHCKKLKPVYGSAAVKMKEENVSGRLAVIDLTKRMDIADKFNIVSVPALHYFRKGEFMKVYDAKRTTEDIVNFMKNPPETPSSVSKIEI